MGHHGHVKKKNALRSDPQRSTHLSISRTVSQERRLQEPVIGPDVVQTLHQLTGVRHLPPWMERASCRY